MKKKRFKFKLKYIIFGLVAILVASFSAIFININSKKTEVAAEEITYVNISDYLDYQTYTYPNVPAGLTAADITGVEEQMQYVVITNLVNNNWYNASSENHYSLEIPAYINDFPVKAILTGDDLGKNQNATKSKWAQKGVNHIEKVVVPESVDYIQSGSFAAFDAIAEMEIPFVGIKRGRTSATQSFYDFFLAIFGDDGFNPMSNYKYGRAGSGKVQDEISTAPYYDTTDGTGRILAKFSTDTNQTKYFNCPSQLKKLKVTDEVCLAPDAFLNEVVLEDVSIEFATESSKVQMSGYGSIGNYAFSNCYNIVNLELPTEATSLGNGMCTSCIELLEIQIPNGPESVPDDCFAFCYKLKKAILSSQINIIGNHAFDRCYELDTIYSAAQPDREVEGTYALPISIKKIGVSAFRQNKKVNNIIVGTAVEEIQEYAFNGCDSLTAITLPFVGRYKGNSQTAEALFGYVFGAYNLNSSEDLIKNTSTCTIQNFKGYGAGSSYEFKYYIPASLINVTITSESYLNTGAFMNCHNIQSLQIDSTTSAGVVDGSMRIAEQVLYGCDSLKDLNIPFVGPQDADYNTGYYFGWIFGRTQYPNSTPIYNNGGTAYYIPYALETVTLNHQTHLSSNSFYRVTNVLNFNIGNSTISAGRGVFAYNTDMQKLSIPFVGKRRGITRDYYASWGSTSYNSFDNTVMYIFSYLSDGSFSYYCDGVTSLRGYPSIWGSYIPNSLYRIEINDETGIDTYAFVNLYNVTQIYISNTVTYIARSSFNNCTSLEYLEVPFIGRDVNSSNADDYSNYSLGYFFYDSKNSGLYRIVFDEKHPTNSKYFVPNSLRRVKIGGTFRKLSSYAFFKCTSLTAVSSNAPIGALGEYCFYNCTNLTTFTFPNATYTYLPNYSFTYTKKIGDMENYTGENVRITSVGAYALAYTNVATTKGNNNLSLDGFTYIGNGAFEGCQQITNIDFTGANLTKLGEYAFNGCTHLTTVNLTQYLAPYLFANCTALQNLDLNYVMQHLKLVDTTSYIGKHPIIPDGLCYNCTALKSSYKVDNVYYGLQLNASNSGVVTIGEYAFYNCKSLKAFTIPNTVTQIKYGAFQKCTGLSSILIPEGCRTIADGKDTKTGVFYGCNDDFYLTVYPVNSDSWPSTWGTNWNCYFPVYSLSDPTVEMYEYEYDTNLRGYVISGFNVYQSTVNENGWDFIGNPISGIIQLPSKNNGLPIVGIKENAFSKEEYRYIVKNLTGFVLPETFVYFGEDAFNLVKEVNSSLVAINLEIFVDATAATARSNTIIENDNNVRRKNYHYNSEGYYAGNAVIYYNDAWELVNGVPKYKAEGLILLLDEDTYTYNYGKKIKPNVIGVTINTEYIKETSNVFELQHLRFIDKYLYQEVNSSYEYIVNSFNYVYSNNINVGRGLIEFTSNNSHIIGDGKLYFQILQREVDIFYESENDNNFYGEYSSLDTAVNMYYLDDPNAKQFVMTQTYNGSQIVFGGKDYWQLGQNYYYLDENYKFSGTLATESANVGCYGLSSGETFELLHNGSTSKGFVWIESPKVLDPDNNDVTSNFKFVISLYIEIEQLVVDGDNVQLKWDYDRLGNNPEYYYRSDVIVPNAVIIDKNNKRVSGKFEYETYSSLLPNDPCDTYLPSTEGTFYIVKILNYDTNNISISSLLLEQAYEIINKNLTVTMNANYTIKETDNCFAFSDWNNYTDPSYANYRIEISGLNEGSLIYGTAQTANYLEGIYKSSNYEPGFDMFFTGTGLKIYSSKLMAGSDPLDETNYYNLSYDLRCTISYQDLEYKFQIGSADLNEDYHDFTSDDPGYVTSNFDKNNLKFELTYEADGYNHEIRLYGTNVITQPNQVWTLTSSGDTSNDYYSFKQIDSYVLTLDVTKEKFYPVKLSVVIHVIKGTYKFSSILKTYDRENVDVFQYLRRVPADFDVNHFDVKFYKTIPGNPCDAIDVGEYTCIINSLESSQWFEDVDNLRIHVSVAPRPIYITVQDNILPKNSKVYDGNVTSVTYNDVYVDGINLLPEDRLTGVFSTKSAQIGTYRASVSGDFVANSTWSVQNDLYGPQRQNYKIIYLDDYTIEPRTMDVEITGYTGVYDYGYHSISVKVNLPNDGSAKVYYSLYGLAYYDPLDLEATFTFDNYTLDTSDDYEKLVWSETRPAFIQPGTYPVYVCVVANTYKTYTGSALVTITGDDITYDLDSNPVFIHDGFDHKNELTNLNPITTVVYYKYLGHDPVNVNDLVFDKNDGWSANCPSFTDVGGYYVAYICECPFYKTSDIGIYYLRITDEGGVPIDVDIETFNGEYDSNLHGFTITTDNINDLDIYYSVDDGLNWVVFKDYEVDGNHYTLNLYSQIGTYPVRFKIRQANHQMIDTIQNIVITRIDIGEVTGNDLTLEFDNQYHTITLTGANIYPAGLNSYYYQLGFVTIPLTLRYSKVYTFNNSDSDAWSEDVLQYKDVGVYVIYIEISAPGIQTVFVSGTLTITMPGEPPAIEILNDYTKEYDKNAVTEAEILACVNTIHDGDVTFLYFEYDYNPMQNAPSVPGVYYVQLVYALSNNCLPSTSGYIQIEITKRVIGIIYSEKVEYEKTVIDYHILSDTGTADEFELEWTINANSDYDTLMNIGQYYLDVSIPIEYEPYYVLPDGSGGSPNYQYISVEITKRMVYVKGEYYHTYAVDSFWEKDSEWEVENALPGDHFTGYLRTSDYKVGTYENPCIYQYGDGWYNALAPGSSNESDYYSLMVMTYDYSTYLNMLNELDAPVDYYYIKLEVVVHIQYPPIELTVEGGTYVYDGLDKTPIVNVISSYEGDLFATYWLEGQTINQGTAQLALRDVGVYKIYYSIYAYPYSPKTNAGGDPIIVTITQAHPYITITSEDEKVYDKLEYELTYEAPPLVYISSTEAPLIYYYELDELAKLGYGIEDLDDFYLTGMNKNHRIYSIWNTNFKVTRKSISTAGNYIVYVYFPGTPNVSATYSSKQIVIHKRALYFTYLDGIIDVTKTYDSYPYIIYLNNFEYDDSPLSLNKLDPNCGLLEGDYIQYNNGSLYGYSFQTVSADCRGEDSDPYQEDGDFVFYWINDDRPSIYIRNSANKFEIDNYYPAFNKANDDTVVKIRILRIDLECFYVPDSLTFTYNGNGQEIDVDKIDHRTVYTSSNSYKGNYNEALIKAIKTTSDGNILVRKFITDDAYTFNGTQTEVNEIVDVGKYVLLVSQAKGTNYNEWKGASDYELEGIKYKICNVEIVPYKAEVIWSKTSATYDAEAQIVTAHIKDVFGNTVQLELHYYNANNDEITAEELVDSDSYRIVAVFGSVSLGIDFDNYILTNSEITFVIKPRTYTITINEKKLYVYQVQTYNITETYFASQLPTWISKHSLVMTISTGSQPMPGLFETANDFVITWTITDIGPNEVIETHNSVNHNYIFNYNLHVELIEDTLHIYKDDLIEGEFTDTYYRPILTSNYNLRDVNIEYDWVEMIKSGNEYVYPSGFELSDLIYRSDVPQFRNVGYYRVFFKATLQNKSDSDVVTGYQDIHIHQKESYLEILELSRVYNGEKIVLVEDQNVFGKYNRATDKGLIFTYYLYDDQYDIYEPVEEARNIGKYKVVITSLGDNDPSVPQNYTEIYEEVYFEISRRTLKITLDLDWVLKNSEATQYTGGTGEFIDSFSDNSIRIPQNMTKTVNTYFAAEGQADYSNYYAHLVGKTTVSGLIVGDRLYLNLFHPGGYMPDIYKYSVSGVNHYYIEGLDDPANTTYCRTSINGDNGFELVWQIDYDTGEYDGDNPVISYAHINNYVLEVDFKYHIHFPDIDVEIVQKQYDYDGTARAFYSANRDESCILFEEGFTGYTITYGTIKGTYNISSYTVILPGSHHIYFEITCPNYEPYYGEAVIIINYKSRDGNLGYLADGKEYNALAYDSENPAVTDIHWLDDPGESLPDPSTYTYVYYQASKKGNDYIIASQAYEEVKDAGDYICQVTIPAGTLYGKTVLRIYFKISLRPIIITVSGEFAYAGGDIEYNIVDNVYGYASTTGLINDLPNVHRITSGKIKTSGPDVNDYYPQTVNPVNYIRLIDVDIKDQGGNLVTRNYNIQLAGNSVVTITKGNIKVINANMEYNSIDGYFHTYDGNFFTPLLRISVPSGLGVIEYSEDNINWSTEPISKVDVGSYTIYYRVRDVDNYYDVYPGGDHNSNCEISNPFVFNIKYAQNAFVEIRSLDKYYDGAEINRPYIRTKDYTGYANDDVTLVYYKKVNGVYQVFNEVPKDAAQYKVVIQYPDTNNFTGISTEVEFEIFKTPITLSFDQLIMTYDTQEKLPNVSLSTEEYPLWNLNQIFNFGTDYFVDVYDQSDSLFANPIATPKNVGDYVAKYRLSADKAKNFTFTNDLDVINYNYSIKKRDITISFVGLKSYTGESVGILVSEMSFTNFPNTVQLAATSIIFTNSTAPGQYTCNNLYDSIQFTSVYHFAADNPKIQYIETPSLFDDLSNYNITCNISITLSSDVFPYIVSKYDGVYDGSEHSFTFTPLAECEGVAYSIDGGSTFTETLPTKTNYTGGPVHIIVRVQSQVYAPNEPNNYIYFGADSQASDYDEFTINITKAARPISFALGTSLDKIYDDKMIVDPEIESFGTTGYETSIMYRYVRIDGQNEIEVSNLTSVYNIGDYKVYVYIAETLNYNQSETIYMTFTISPRDIVIKYLQQSKEFDATLWESVVSNDSNVSHGGATIVGVSNVLESGLVSGHLFRGVLQTYSANVGYYEIDPTDFNWQNGYRIYRADDSDVTQNYNIIIDVQVTITKASFDMNYSDYVGDYDGFLHRITVEFNSNPHADGDLANLISYSTDGGVTWVQGSNPGFSTGTNIVYWKVEAPNYNTFNYSNIVKIIPLSNNPKIVFNTPLTYTGEHAIVVESITSGQEGNGDTRVPTIRYYTSDGTFIGQELYDNKNTATPVDAGNYYLVFVYDTQDQFEGFTSDQYPFTINKYTVSVIWITELSNPNRMVYTGEVVTPLALATGLNAHDIVLTTRLVSPVDGQAIEVGNYTMQALIVSDEDKKNYVLENNTLTFAIVQMTDIVPPPGDGSNSDYSVYQVEFETPSVNPLTLEKYTYGDKIGYLVLNITYMDSLMLTHSYRYAIEFSLINGTINCVYDLNEFNSQTSTYQEVWIGLHNQILFNIVPPESLDLLYDSIDGSYINVKARLFNNNYSWGSQGDNQAKDIRLLFNQKEVLVDEGTITLYAGSPLDSYNFTTEESTTTYQVNGRNFTIVWSNSRLTFNVYVALTKGTTEEGDDTLLVENKDYELIWENNDQITNNAKLTIRSINTSNYNFEIVKTFSIISPIPDYLELVRNYIDEDKNKDTDPELKVGFVYYEFENLVSALPSVTKTLLKNETRGEVVADEANSGKILKNIYLGNVHQELILRKLDTQFVHAEGQTIRYVYIDSEGNEQYWDDQSMDPDDPTKYIYDTKFAYTGLKVCLYKNSDLNNPIDTITIIVTGDANGDGYSNILDVNASISVMKEVASSENFEAYVDNIEYLALLIQTTDFKVVITQVNSLVSWTKVSTSDDDSVKDPYDFNIDYKIV